MVGSKEALDSSVTSSGDSTNTSDSTNTPNSISRGKSFRREVLIRQPSYCKILDDLQGTEERVLKLEKESNMPESKPNVLEVLS